MILIFDTVKEDLNLSEEDEIIPFLYTVTEKFHGFK